MPWSCADGVSEADMRGNARDATSITTSDGRRIAYLEVGDPQGPLVLHNHGGPSSRLEARFFADAATTHGVRFVGLDRPGIGQSSPQRDRTYAGWCDDMVAVADALGHHEFGVSGWSEGGPWPLAAAAYIDPARLRHVTSIAGGNYGTFGDNWAKDQLAKQDAFGGWLALRFTPGLHLMYAALGLSAKRLAATYVKQISRLVNGYDREVLARPGVATAFGEMSAECFAQGAGGLVADAQLLYRRWAFDVTTIERPVHMWQGTDDKLVPFSINRTIGDRMPGTVWHQVEGGGHLIAISCADEIVAIAAAELAGATS